MAYNTIHVNGPAILQIGAASGGLTRLGVSDRGVQITFNAGFTPVIADDEGEYMPADVQFMGVMAQISGRLTRWEDSIIDKLRSRLPTHTQPGQIDDIDIGTLLFAAQETWQLFIESAARTGLPLELPYRFPRVVPTEAFSLNVGTRYSEQPFGFTAYRQNKILYTRG